MSNWLDGTEMSNIWGTFKSKLAASLTSLSNRISQNASDITKKIGKENFGLLSLYRCKSTDITYDKTSDLWNTIGYSDTASSAHTVQRTITESGRIFCDGGTEINPKTASVTHRSSEIPNSNITYKKYIGTYTSGSDVYAYYIGTGSSGYGIFKVKYGNETQAESITKLYLCDITDEKYYPNATTGTQFGASTSTNRLYTKFATLIGDTVYIATNSDTSGQIHGKYADNYYEDKHDLWFSWNGSVLKPLTINAPSDFYTNLTFTDTYTVNYISYRGFRIATTENATYADGYKFTAEESDAGSTVTVTPISSILPLIGKDNTQVYCNGFYNNYVVFCDNSNVSICSCKLVPKNNCGYHELMLSPMRLINSAFAHTSDSDGEHNYGFFFLPAKMTGFIPAGNTFGTSTTSAETVTALLHKELD